MVQQIRTLLTGDFVRRQENVLLSVPRAVARRMVVAAIAQELVRAGQRVLFTKCNLLVQELLVAKRDLTLKGLLRRLANWDVLLIDDLGYVQQSREEMEVLFTLLAERYEMGSVMVTSNLAFSKWDQVFKDPMTTAAAIDRLVHHCTIVGIKRAQLPRGDGQEGPEGAELILCREELLRPAWGAGEATGLSPWAARVFQSLRDHSNPSLRLAPASGGCSRCH